MIRINWSNVFIVLQAVAIVIIIMVFMTYCDRQEQEKQKHNFELKKTRNKLNQETTRANVYIGTLKELRKDSAAQLERLQSIEKEYKRKLQAATALTIHAKETVSGKPTVAPKDTIEKGGIKFVYPVYMDTINRKYSRYHLYMSKDSSSITSFMSIPVDLATVRAGERKNILSRRALVMDVKLMNPSTEISELATFTIPPEKQYNGVKIIGAFLGGAAGMYFILK